MKLQINSLVLGSLLENLWVGIVLLILSISILSSCICAVVHDFDYKNCTITKKIDKSNSHLFFLTDSQGEKFIVKQLKGEPYLYLAIAHEIVGVSIARSMGISCNPVDLIPAEQGFSIKFFKDKPATIHGFVPGKPIAQVKKFYGATIQQPLEWKGLTLAVMRNFVLHAEFARLAAFDTFTGNNDRHRANVLYDEVTNKVFGIDFSRVFGMPLAEYAYLFVNKLINKKPVFSAFEREALTVYRDTLIQLARRFPPKIVYEKYDIIMHKLLGARRKKGLVSTFISRDKNIFKRNYMFVPKLIDRLTKLLELSK